MTDSSDDYRDDTPSNHAADVARLKRQIADLTQRAERAETETRAFRELAEHIDEVFWMTNALGDELVYISPAYERIWGQTCNSLHAEPGRRLAWVDEADRERVLKAFKRDARADRYNEIFRIQRPDGEVRWIHDRAWRVFNDHGDLYRLAGFARDITQEMADHDRVCELGDRLAISERLGVFAALGAGLAHDLGQPLTAARNHLAHARSQNTANDNASLEAIAKADGAIGRASDIVQHLRDYARQGHPSLGWQRLGSVLGEIHELSNAALRRAHIDYVTDVDADDARAEISLDRVFVQQILRNLIQNAIEALAVSDTPEASRRIVVHADLVDDYHIEISVSDNGEGIEESIEPFTAFDTTKVDGLGLGLHVSRSLARSMGGDLTLEAPERNDMRTRFLLRLPRDGQIAPRLPPVADVSVADATSA